MDDMEQMMQQILAQINANQKKVEASMAKLLEDKMDAKMDSYQKKAEAGTAKLFEDKIDSYQEKAEACMAKLEEKIEEIMEAFLTKIDAL
jgi:Skp family chaperone for outer membrane proteins